jgi:hypothetical protein
MEHNDTEIVGIQVLILNECNSPVLLGKNQTDQNLQKVKITSQVKKIRVNMNFYDMVCKIYF